MRQLEDPRIIRQMSHSGIKAEKYNCGPTDLVGTPDELRGRLSKDARARLEAAIAEIVAVEAPIQLDALIRKIGKRFGYKRVPRNRQRTIAYRIPGGVLIKEGNRSFVWREGSSAATWRAYRVSNGGRTVSEIPTTELANALVSVAENSTTALDHEGLYRKTIALFGLSRLTAKSIDYLEEALVLAIIRGDLVDEGAQVSPTSSALNSSEAVEVIEVSAGEEPEYETLSEDSEVVAKQNDSLEVAPGITFKCWSLKPGTSISPLVGNQRKGIYVLEFEDSHRYVGLTNDIVTRLSTHRHGSAHHSAWDDIVTLWFREMPEGDLRQAEREEIQRQLSLGHKLRNKVMNFGHTQGSALDVEVAIEYQKHWLLGDGEYELPDLESRMHLKSNQKSKLLSHVPKDVPEEIYECVLDDISFFLSAIIPNAVSLEKKYWTISDWPSTAGGRLATLNVGALEFAYFPRRPFTDPSSFSDDTDYFVFFNLPADIMDFGDEIDLNEVEVSFKTDTFTGVAAKMIYPMVETTHVGVPVGFVRDFFENDPEMLPKARQFAIDLMAYRDSGIFRRFHSSALTDEVFEHYRKNR